VDAPVPLIAVALLAGLAVVAPGARSRALAMLLALGLTPAILLSHIWDSEQLEPLRDAPALFAAGGAAGILIVAGLALIFHQRPALFPLAVVATLPFRIPIALGGSTANLLVPLYAVIGAGVLAYAVPRVLRRPTPEEHRPRALELALVGSVAAYAVQSTYSSDFDKALEQVVFFYVPFTLLFSLLGRVEWSRDLALRCLGVLVALAVVFAGIGFVEYATRHVLLNPKVIASNQFESYFRVNSLFFDPNIYGRFLAIVMLGVAAVLIWTRERREVIAAGVLLAVLWGGLVLTFSQSSFAALLVGLAVLAGMRWSSRRAWVAAGGVLALGVAVVLLAPGSINLELGDSKSFDSATSGRVDLLEGGGRLFTEEPVTGHGSGAFSREYRRAEDASSERATSASHTIPVTVAAEQGAGGLLLYLVLIGLAFWRLFRGVRGSPVRAAVAASFAALFVHTLSYAAFLEDPLTWVLLGVGVALARRDPPEAQGTVPLAA
jgi:O-antigen ligase